MHKDYYSLLGVSISAEPELIDKAYRILARRWHPDQSGRGADVSRFEQLQEAYGVLSDPAMRAMYDRGTIDAMRAMYDRGTIETNADAGQTQAAGVVGHTFQILRLRFEQALRGGKVTVNMLTGRHSQRLDVAVPRGVAPGDRIRIQGVAPPDGPGAPSGDLILIIDVRPHPSMYRKGLDLYAETKVPLEVAIKGGVVPLSTPEGDVEVTVPPHTTSGSKILLRSRGITDARGKRGDLYAVVQIDLPKDKEALDALLSPEPAAQAKTPPPAAVRAPIIEGTTSQQAGKADIEAERARLREQHGLLEQNRRMIEEQATRLSNQQREADDRHQRMTALQRELDAAQKRIRAEQTGLNGRRVQLDEQFALVEGRATVLDQRETKLRSETDKSEAARLELLAEQDRLDGHRGALERLREELAAESRRQDQHRAFLDDRAADIDGRQESLDGFRAELDHQAARLDEVQAACEDKAAELMAIEKQLESRAVHIAQEEHRLEEDRSAVRKNLEEADQIRRQLSSNQLSIELDRRRLSSDLEQLESQRRDLEQIKQKIGEQQAGHAAGAGDRRAMNDEAERIERTKAELHAASMRLAAERERLSRERSELVAARASLAAARDELGTELARIESDRRSLRSLHDNIIAARAELEQRESAQADSAAQRAELEQRAKRLQSRLAEAEQRTEQHRRRADEAERRAANPNPNPTINAANAAAAAATNANASTSHASSSTARTNTNTEADSKRRTASTTSKSSTPPTPPTPPTPQSSPSTPASSPSSAASNPQSAEALAAQTSTRFAFHRAGRHAAAEAAPNHLRTAACYIDRIGNRHLIADSVDPTRSHQSNNTATWAATLHAFRAEPNAPFQSQGIVIRPGAFNTENPERSAPDCHGTASPALLLINNFVLLAYAGRGNCAPDARPAVLAGPDKPNRLISRIMLAAAPADQNGAPAGPFTKLGSVIEPHEPFATLRVDHPSLIIHNNQLHILYTAYDSALDLTRRVLGRAVANLNPLTQHIEQQLAQPVNANNISNANNAASNNITLAQLFTPDSSPLLAVEGGGETPRLFHHNNTIHLLYRHFDRTHGTRWRHHTTPDLNHFTINDPNLFDGLADPDNDVTPLIDTQGRLAKGQNLYVSGTELNIYKQWAFELRNSR